MPQRHIWGVGLGSERVVNFVTGCHRKIHLVNQVALFVPGEVVLYSLAACRRLRDLMASDSAEGAPCCRANLHEFRFLPEVEETAGERNPVRQYCVDDTDECVFLAALGSSGKNLYGSEAVMSH